MSAMGTGIGIHRQLTGRRAVNACSPQTLMGATSSRRLGWERKISLAVTQRCRISVSVSCTFFPVALCFFPSSNRRMRSSTVPLSIARARTNRQRRASLSSSFVQVQPVGRQPCLLGRGTGERKRGTTPTSEGGGHGREGANERNPRVGLCSLGFRSMPAKRLASDNLPNRDGWRREQRLLGRRRRKESIRDQSEALGRTVVLELVLGLFFWVLIIENYVITDHKIRSFPSRQQ